MSLLYPIHQWNMLNVLRCLYVYSNTFHRVSLTISISNSALAFESSILFTNCLSTPENATCFGNFNGNAMAFTCLITPNTSHWSVNEAAFTTTTRKTLMPSVNVCSDHIGGAAEWHMRYSRDGSFPRARVYPWSNTCDTEWARYFFSYARTRTASTQRTAWRTGVFEHTIYFYSISFWHNSGSQLANVSMCMRVSDKEKRQFVYFPHHLKWLQHNTTVLYT